MKSSLLVLQADGVNLYKQLLPTELLIDGLRDTFANGLPQCLGHDTHRPLGWAFATGVYFKPRQGLLIGESVIGENEQDSTVLAAKHRERVSRNHFELTKKYRESLEEMLGNALNEDYKVFHAGCAGILQEGLAKTAFPEVAIQTDNEGLVSIKALLEKFEYLSQGVFAQKDGILTIHAHQYFRRSMSRLNAYHYQFLDELIKLCSMNDLDVKVRIDPDFVGHKDSFKHTGELDFWYGPGFQDQIDQIPSGYTVHGSTDHEKVFSNVLKTEFYWNARDGKHFFECEEVADSPTLGISSEDYGCRYIHAIHDDHTMSIVHFDGSVRTYAEEEMIRRQEERVHDSGKEVRYTKLFRIDGNFPVPLWKTMCVLYLQGNYQIKPYFNVSESDAPDSPTAIHPEDEDAGPTLLGKDAGPRIYLSIHKTDESTPKEISFINYDGLIVEGVNIPAVEAEVIELIKQFKAQGGGPNYNEEALRVDFGDSHLNIPTVFHPLGYDSKESVLSSVEVVRLFLGRISKYSGITVVSLSLSWAFEGIRLQISIAGTVEDVDGFLGSALETPKTWPELREYSKRITQWLWDKRGQKIPFPDIRLICRDGALYFSRPTVNHKLEFEEGEDGKTLIYPGDRYKEQLDKRGLRVEMSKIILFSLCSECNEEYKTCPHLKDEGKVQEIVKKMKIGAFVETLRE